jgi:peroxiredoxin
MRPLAIALFVGACVTVSGMAQGTKKVAVGAAAPVFDLPGVDGKNHSLADYANKDVLVLCITCNHCPIAVEYAPLNIDFAKKHAKDVAFVAISVSREEADTMAEMKEHAKEQKFNFPYLRDASQQMGRQLGAVATPEYYVFNKDRKLVYMGAMDDSSHQTNYLAQAVEAARQNQPAPKGETRPRGCRITYVKAAE